MTFRGRRTEDLYGRRYTAKASDAKGGRRVIKSQVRLLAFRNWGLRGLSLDEKVCAPHVKLCRVVLPDAEPSLAS